MIFDYFKKSFARKKARREFQVYTYEIQTYDLESEGEIQFAKYMNPLVNSNIPKQETINFFKKFIISGSLCIDIGAFIGDTTVPMALAAGKDGLCLGFEPNPHTFKILQANASLNKNKSNMKAFPFAITESDGEFYYSSTEASISNGGLSDSQDFTHGKFSLEEKITGKNLEEFLNQNFKAWIPKISLIKIDVEGHDKEILKSIAPILKKYKPDIIAECFGGLNKEERNELFDVLDLKGYKLYFVDDFNVEENAIQLKREDMMDRKHFDFYAVCNSDK